ncbi:MAG: YicC family protein [Clostridia bacterium]|nr:YicC family protein [Clostridia bacterium]
MLSMTGYGKGEYKQNGLELTVEIKTVNNRFLDVSIKSPRVFVAYEEVIRATIREKLTRGHADVFVNLTDKREKEKKMYLDEALAAAYVDAANRLREKFPQLTDDVTLTSVLRYGDVLKQEETQGADEELIQALQTALEAALEKLNAMRAVEGEKLKKDLLSRMNTVETLVNGVAERAPAVAENYKTKLTERVQKALEGVEIDQARLLNEVAIFTDKSNIDEELTRLKSHIAQFRAICEEKIVGRKLDFLVQEFNRESNTVCSKSNDLTVTSLGLSLKNEIEKIREQVQNLE